ncbi:phage tail assembly chaperone [Lactobacillus hominis]|uniref:Phage XkdN-like protein n=1 Tax=Lactobacillus hominis DSM 23910 = CRBIP 24.179 TaxID=1423758 RepID=I7JV03_9LACO|nr:hypothetical protein [Lactobacillus hominis]KRM85747.1 hypothetical protein FC41_GL001062 [Lactobacillus hominis DSM 23910 = CRBIP 24.179]MCT3347205.1 hypothetical protein [Lactobacillus hominis]CCI81986.1 Putative uncharacterized protein orf47 [Lactobacillus hominis DSM 23910 = CRBIP 24.179]
MTASVSDFLLENVESPVKHEQVKFKRFKSPFEIKSLNMKEISSLRKEATRRVLNKKTHQYENDTDQDKFSGLVMERAVVSPSLNNEELQKSYGCIADPSGLLQTMLTAGEYSELSDRVMEICGLNDDSDDAEVLKDEAKN